jgi:hypothetical protein
MPSYEIVFARSARKELQALTHTVAEHVLKKAELLALNPGLLVARSFADIQVFGEYELVSTELFIVLTMINELSMYQLFGIEVKRTVKNRLKVSQRGADAPLTISSPSPSKEKD